MTKLEARGKGSPILLSLPALVFAVPAYLVFLSGTTAGFFFGVAFCGAAAYSLRLAWTPPLRLVLTADALEVTEKGRKRSLRRKDITDLAITRTTVMTGNSALILFEYEVFSGQESFVTFTSAIDGGSTVAACIQKGTLDPDTKLDFSNVRRRVLSR